jgi:hypothetical protein
MKNIIGYPLAAGVITFVLLAVPLEASPAVEVDFSCMKLSVRTKARLSDQYMEYDVIIHNQCPGAVYWSACIERMDPWTHEIVETHTPSGQVAKEEKSRVNLLMKKGPDTVEFRNRFQEFYASAGYSLSPPAQASCIARSCEAEKSELRKQVSANEKAWADANDSLNTRLASECPASGWDNSEQKVCEAQIRKDNQAVMAEFVRKDAELRERLGFISPMTCKVHGGELMGG